jgi:hypothetical protein
MKKGESYQPRKTHEKGESYQGCVVGPPKFSVFQWFWQTPTNVFDNTNVKYIHTNT